MHNLGKVQVPAGSIIWANSSISRLVVFIFLVRELLNFSLQTLGSSHNIGKAKKTKQKAVRHCFSFWALEPTSSGSGIE